VSTAFSTAKAAPNGLVDLSEAARVVVHEHAAAPAASLAAALRQADGQFRFGAGSAGTLFGEPGANPTSIETPFDLASVTKPIIALVMARLERAKRIDRRMALKDVLPELAKTASADVPLDLFAAHRAGLEAHGPLYAPLTRGERVDASAALLTAANARRAECVGAAPREGFAPVYSDLGYLLLGAAITRIAGELDEVVAQEIATPLGISIGSARQKRLRDASFDEAVAPTEIVPFRGGVVRGVVHDENAFAISGHGTSGHAGLFGSALDIMRLGVAVLKTLAGEQQDWLRQEDLAPLVRPRPQGTLLAGFDSRSGDEPSSGARLGPRTFGHLGFTGTSLWIDPEAGFVGVLLSNRVHPLRTSLAIRRARPHAYDCMFDAMTR